MSFCKVEMVGRASQTSHGSYPSLCGVPSHMVQEQRTPLAVIRICRSPKSDVSDKAFHTQKQTDVTCKRDL